MEDTCSAFTMPEMCIEIAPRISPSNGLIGKFHKKLLRRVNHQQRKMRMVEGMREKHRLVHQA